jgi:hypothetical protein
MKCFVALQVWKKKKENKNQSLMKGYECYLILKYPPIVLASINNYIFKTQMCIELSTCSGIIGSIHH